MLNNRKIKIKKTENELKKLKNELSELIKNQIDLPLNFVLSGTDGLKEDIPKLKQEFLKGNIDIDVLIEKVGSIYATLGFEVGQHEMLNICEYETKIDEKEKELLNYNKKRGYKKC